MNNELVKKPFFTTEEAKSFGISRRMLSYYLEKGIIERIARGIYRSVENEFSIDDESWIDIVAIANKIDGVICLISALNFYGLTDEFMKEYWIAVPHDHTGLNISNTRIVRMRNIEMGVIKVKVCNIDVKIFDVERTIIDTFRLLDIETAVKALKSYFNRKNERANIKKLIKYSKILRVDISKYIEAITI